AGIAHGVGDERWLGGEPAGHPALEFSEPWTGRGDLSGELRDARAKLGSPAADRAPAYAMPAEVIDGNDVLVVAQAVARAADRARSGQGPTVLEARTYRHFGHSRTDPATYRPKEEVQEWLQHDPLDVARARLADLGVPVEDAIAADEPAAAAVA